MLGLIKLIVSCLGFLIAFYGVIFAVLGAWDNGNVKYYRYAKYCLLALPSFIVLTMFFLMLEG